MVVEDGAGSGRMDGGQFIKVTQNINKYFYAHSLLNTYIVFLRRHSFMRTVFHVTMSG